jgi:hypothetical protein
VRGNRSKKEIHAGFRHIAQWAFPFLLLFPLLLGSKNPEKSVSPQQCTATAESQLPCYCEEHGVEKINDTVSPCFLGDMSFQTYTQTDGLSARAFAALNWPVTASNGIPDYTAKPPKGDYATVWESWKSTRDIFLPDGSRPMPWDSRKHWLPAACRTLDVSNEIRKIQDWETVPAALPPRFLNKFVDPQGDAVLDRSGLPVRFEILMNKVAYDYIVTNRLYNREGQEAYFATHGSLSFPAGDWKDPRRGSVVVKAVWKTLDSEAHDFDLYHKSWAYISPEVKDGTLRYACSIRAVGLVGMHISFKLTSLPQWSWATYEHRLVAPRWEQLKDQNQPSWIFFQPYCTNCEAVNRAPGTFSGIPSQIVRQQAPGYYYPRISTSPGPIRCQDYSQEFSCFNQRLAKGFAGSAIGNYLLKGTQWINPNLKPPAVVPAVLANTVIEAYIQPTSSCVDCHRTAKTEPGVPHAPSSDFIFSLQDATYRWTPPQTRNQ